MTKCPTAHFFLPNNDGIKILYTYVRKNACTTFKSVMDAYLDRAGGEGLDKYRAFRAPKNANPQLSIFVHRDPFDRLVSTYSNKIVDLSNAQGIVPKAEELTGKPVGDISFRDFVRAAKKEFFNPHLWPQAHHIGPYEYKFIYIKDLCQQIEILAPSIGKYFAVQHNKSSKGRKVNALLGDAPARELKGIMLRPENFEDILGDVYDIYADDRRFFVYR